MAYASDTHIPHAAPQNILVRAWHGFATFMITMMENDRRLKQIEALQAMSDAQLKERGLRREQIVNYVFRQYMGH
jgi:uncharacterized protein YjiS (DUF1127 family)